MRFRSQFGDYLNELRLLGCGAEIGVFTGQFAKQILERWRGHKLWLIDPWRHESDYLDSFNGSDRLMERRYQCARRRLGRYSRRIGWIRKRSEVAVRQFGYSTLDFVYIDANHSYSHVKRDLTLWFRRVRTGGVVAGHDYFNALADAALEPVFVDQADPALLTSYGVKAALDEFASRHAIRVEYTGGKFRTWYFVKTARGSDKPPRE